MCTHCISLAATPEEMRKVEAIKAHYRRRSTSDVIRFLIEKEADFVLPKNMPKNIPKNMPNSINQQETGHDLENS